MTSRAQVGRHGVEIQALDASFGDFHGRYGWGFRYERLPSEPIGTTTVTFAGVNAGSEIRVYDASANELAGVESGAADQQLSWPVYSSGNTVRIVIVHPSYKIKEFAYTSTLGNQSVPVQQEPDKWYSNPA